MPLSLREMDQLSQNVVTIYDTKFPYAATKTVIGVIILKTILFTLLRNVISLPIYGQDINKRAAEIRSNVNRNSRQRLF
jgi:hypothetical protein